MFPYEKGDFFPHGTRPIGHALQRFPVTIAFDRQDLHIPNKLTVTLSVS